MRYICLAATVLLISFVIAAASIYTGHSRVPSVGWLGFAGFTPMIFWAVINALRMHWRRPAFWFAIAGLATLHIVIFAATLVRYPQWRLLWFIPVSCVEAGVFVVLLGWLFDHGGGSH